MSRWLLLTLVLGASTALAREAAHTVVFTSECSCENDHGVQRWRAKTDRSEPPNDLQNTQAVVPSDLFGWQGPGTIPRGGARLGVETRWFALTGRVITLQTENDGDLHMVLVDPTGDKPGKVIAEIPLGDRWCTMRTAAFSWTTAAFPFELTRDEYPFELTRHPIITVIGKAFYDTDHAGKDFRNNRRPRAKDKAVWEIHPVMKMHVDEAPPAPAAPPSVVSSPAANRAPSTPAPVATPVVGDVQFVVTLTRQVTLKIPYGEIVLPAGKKLSAISRDNANVVIRFDGADHIIPISSTDLK